MRNRLIKTLSALATVFAAITPAQAQRYELNGDKVAVYNLVGSVRVEAGTGSSVVVQVTAAGRDAARLKVVTGTIDGVSTLRVIYPGDEIVADMDGNSNTTVRVNEDGTFNRGREGRRVKITTGRGGSDATHAQASIVVRVPQNTAFAAHQAVGDVSAQDVVGDLSLNTSSGEIGVTGGRGELRVNTASGEIGVQGTQGNLYLETASGDVGVQNVNATTIQIDVASGSIDLQDAKANKVDLETASGDIRVRRTTAPDLKANSASGNVRADLDGTVRDVELNTASGRAEAVLSADFAGEVELDTASGDIDVDFPVNIIRQRQNYMRGTIGQGGTAHVSINSASGNVKLLRR